MERSHQTALSSTFLPSTLPLTFLTNAIFGIWKMSTKKKKKEGQSSDRNTKARSHLTRCCISAVSCLPAGMCACGGSKGNHLFLGTVPGEDRVLEDTRTPQRTPPGTDPLMQLVLGVGGMRSSGDMRTHSLKRLAFWDRCELRRCIW